MVSRVRRALRMQLLPLGLGFAALAAIVGMQSWLTATQWEENQAIRDTFALQRRITSALSLVQEAETSQRGFLLTGEASYLDPYRAAVRALPAEMAAIRESVADNPARRQQLEQLDSATKDRLAEMDAVLRLYTVGGSPASVARLKEGRGKAAMGRVRDVVSEMQRDENAKLQQRLDISERADDALRFASFAVLLGVLAVAAYGMAAARRHLRDIAAAQESLTAKNAALESAIETGQAAEAQLRQMQKMEAIGQLTGGIAHDFNNMLAVIMSAMSLARRKLSRGDTDVSRFIEAASDAAERASELTQRLLAFARQQPLAPQVIDANGTVTGMSKLLRRTLGKTVRIETQLAAGLWLTHVDKSQLENAILNLAVNGRDAMPDGGSLTISTANRTLDDRHPAGDVPAGQFIVIAVSDTGIGMPPEVAAKAFEPFFTTKGVSKGTGLGLSQVYGFVKQSGGHVDIMSEPGKGTTVNLYLKRYLGEEQPNEAGAEAHGHEPVRALVLVAEDDAQVRAGSLAALRELGYRVIEAGGSAEALRKLDAHPDIDLLFTDIVMPGMNGRELAQEAVKRKPGLVVLFTSGYTRETAGDDVMPERSSNFLAKPFTIEQLAAKIPDVLGTSRAPAAAGSGGGR
jgi:signal transduction histidine kinase/CheY-like chemotaxis protein